MINPYSPSLITFFETITDFKHSSNRINSVLLKDVERYTTEGARYFSGTSLIIGDWTGPTTDKGWKLPFHTGIKKAVFKENYTLEIENLLSREFSLSFAQCYEAFETLLKDFIWIKIKNDDQFRNSLSEDYSRKSLNGGDRLFNLVKKAGANRFQTYSNRNNNTFRFKETFDVLSEARHAITHSQGKLKTSKILKSKYHKDLYEHFFY